MMDTCWLYLVRLENRKNLEIAKQDEQERHRLRLLEIDEAEKLINTPIFQHMTIEKSDAWIKHRAEGSADHNNCKLPDGTLYCASIPLPDKNVAIKNRYGLDCYICTIEEESFKDSIEKEKTDVLLKRGFKKEICIGCGELFSTRNGTRCRNCQTKFNRNGNFKSWAKGVISRHKTKGYEITFDFEWLAKLAEITPNCQLCGCEMVYGKRDFERMASLDRKHNGTSLTTENVGIVCHKCNRVKGDLTPESVATWANGLNTYITS